jgi:hypothetical protein
LVVATGDKVRPFTTPHQHGEPLLSEAAGAADGAETVTGALNDGDEAVAFKEEMTGSARHGYDANASGGQALQESYHAYIL